MGDLRRVLNAEMDKAERTLKSMEVQFLEMPNPYADEVRTLRERIELSTQQLACVSKENLGLIKELKDARISAMESQKELEKKLGFTIEVMNKMKAQGSIKLLANADFMDLLAQDDDGELTWEEVLPMLIAKGLKEDEARAIFEELDVSGDGKVTK